VVGCGAKFLGVSEVDEDGAEAGALTAVDVAPAVADHPRAGEIESESLGGVGDHPGLGLAAVVIRVGATLAGRVADLDVLEGRDQFAQASVHRFDDGLGLITATDVGLIGGDDEDEAGGGELGAGFGHTREEGELGEGGRRVGFAVANDLNVERAVTVEENGGAEIFM